MFKICRKAALLGTTIPEVVTYPPKLVSPALTTLEIYVKPATGKK